MYATPRTPPAFSASPAAEDATATKAAAASLPGSAADVYRLWGPMWAGEGAPPLLMTVEVAAEAVAGGAGAKTVRLAVDMDAHSRALARCVIEHAPTVRDGGAEGREGREPAGVALHSRPPMSLLPVAPALFSRGTGVTTT